ncbi:MAG: Panacea domain-containing protein [Candidatus Saccharibacteria bacterium]
MTKEVVSEKTKQLIDYLVSKHHLSTVTSLVKLCYLCDLVSVGAGNDQITNFNYYRWHFGPYDRKIEDALFQLVERGDITSDTTYTDYGTEYVKYNVSDDSEPTIDKLTKTDLGHVNAVLDSLKGYGPKALTQVAYKTKPMLALGATLGGTENMGKPLDLTIK